MRLSFLRAVAGIAVAVVLFSCSNQTSQLTSTQTLSQVKLVAVNGGVQATLVSASEENQAAGLKLCYVGSGSEINQTIGMQQGVATLLQSATCASATLNTSAGNYVAFVEFPKDIAVGFFAVVDNSKRVQVLTQMRSNATSVVRNLVMAGANPYDIDDISVDNKLLSFNGSYVALRSVATSAASSQVTQAFPLVPSALEEDDFSYAFYTGGLNQEYGVISAYNYGNSPFSTVTCGNNTIVNPRVAYAVNGEIADAYVTSPSVFTLLVNSPSGLQLATANCAQALQGSGVTGKQVKQVNAKTYYDGIFSPDLTYAYMLNDRKDGLFDLIAVTIADGTETALATFSAGSGDAPLALFSLPRRPSSNGVTYAVLQNKAGKDGQALLRFSGAQLQVFTGANVALQAMAADAAIPLSSGLPKTIFQIQGQSESIVIQGTEDADVIPYTYQNGQLVAGEGQKSQGRLVYVSLDGKTNYFFSPDAGLSAPVGTVSPSLWIDQAVLTSAQEVYARSDGRILRNSAELAGITGATGLTVNAADAYVVNAENLYQVTAGQIGKTWSVGGDAVAVTVSNAGSTVAAVFKRNLMTLVDTSTGATIPVTLPGTVSGVASIEDTFAIKTGSTITAIDTKGNAVTVATGVIGVGLGESVNGQTSAIAVTSTTVEVYSSANAWTGAAKTIALPQAAVDALQGESDVKVAVGPNGNINIATAGYDIEVYTDGTAAVSQKKKPASSSASAAAPTKKATIVATGQLDVDDGNAYQLEYVAKPNS